MTDFLNRIPDRWALLSIVYANPNGISSFALAKEAMQQEATTGVVNEIRNRMLSAVQANLISSISNGVGDVVYKKKSETPVE